MKKIDLFFIAFLVAFLLFNPENILAEGNATLENDTESTMSADTPATLTSSTFKTGETANVAAANTGKISGYVWNDANKDGVFQPESEKPIEGVTVYLYNAGNPIASTTTIATGDFSFSELAMSNYEIILNQSSFGTGSILSTKFNWNGQSKNNNFTKKSNDPTKWTSGTIALSKGETLSNFGCGVYDPTLLSSEEVPTQTDTTTNPKTADESYYILPVIGLMVSIALVVISRRNIVRSNESH